jgi:hypothetical protein
MKASRSFETSGTTLPATRRRIPQPSFRSSNSFCCGALICQIPGMSSNQLTAKECLIRTDTMNLLVVGIMTQCVRLRHFRFSDLKVLVFVVRCVPC